ncbi:hypothetical protein DL769_008546 [Monosporascus sp. CRB-8-3]|nr:hypothetical protein DL769_008546 [Monosporascus sp. CRB-8-3]
MSLEDGRAYNEKLMAMSRGDERPDRNIPVEYMMFLSALMRFSMALHLSPEDLALVRPVERNFGKQLSVMNDIYSFDKEVLASQNGHEGGFLCSAVSTLSEVLAVKDNETIRAYLEAFELQMSGNEEWSTTTQRYRVSKV